MKLDWKHARGCFDDSLKIPVVVGWAYRLLCDLFDDDRRRWESGNLIYFLAVLAAIELVDGGTYTGGFWFRIRGGRQAGRKT